jgi:hypothetical protein
MKVAFGIDEVSHLSKAVQGYLEMVAEVTVIDMNQPWPSYARPSASSKPSDTKSSSNGRPDHRARTSPAPLTLRRALPRAR